MRTEGRSRESNDDVVVFNKRWKNDLNPRKADEFIYLFIFVTHLSDTSLSACAAAARADGVTHITDACGRVIKRIQSM